MGDRPLVSVVVPCFDQAHYLSAALASVAAQTYAPIQTLVVDDGSGDDTSGVATRAGIPPIRQANAGVSAARNRGLQEARGTYVIFLDADDELEPDAVESGVALFEQQPEVWMVARCATIMDEVGRLLPTTCLPPKTGDLYGEWLVRNFVWTPGAAVFRRAEFAALGGFPTRNGAASDYAVYLELARNNRVIFDPRMAVRYRQHGNNMSRDPVRMLQSTLAVLRHERRHVPPHYLAAFRRGERAWRTYYGDAIIHRLRADLRAGHVGRPQWQALDLLLRECRGLLARHLLRKLTRLVRGLPPDDLEPGRFASTTAPTSEASTLQARR